MALRDLLYRCPQCGQDPTEGGRDRVRCPGCGCVFERGDPPAGIRVKAGDEKPRTVPASRLSEAIQEMGGPIPAARDADGELRHAADVTFRRSSTEEPVRYRDRLLGFHERLGADRPGTLRLVPGALELVQEATDESRWRWNLMDLRAVQASSSSLQVYTAAGELVQFRFVAESPLRWEALLHAVLRRAYREEGRGEIVEFQPRITVR